MFTRRLLGPGIVAATLLALSCGTPAGYSFQPDKEAPKGGKALPGAADFALLKKIYGTNDVAIVTDDGKVACQNVSIIGVDELFGKQFLRLQTRRGNTILTRADRIATIRIEE